MASYEFPAGFGWGAATASYQIEGAADEDGRGSSVWDTFAAIPGRVDGGDTGMVACDHYHRWREDVALMKELGIGHYRFSVSWPRVLPEGRGAVNRVGMDFYSRLVDELLAAGITPHVTLFHWDSPQALEDEYGSWRDRRIADDFADYASAVVAALGDRVERWTTINEILCFSKLGYGVGKPGVHAPGTAVGSRREVQQTVHHALLAHGRACQAIRAAAPGECSVALVDNPAIPVPVTESDEDVAAAARAFRLQNGDILVPVLTGAYEDAKFAIPGEAAPEIREDDMEVIAQPLDRLGLNVYAGQYVRAIDDDPGYELLPFPPGYPRLHMPWLHLVPEATYWAMRAVHDGLGWKRPCFISENGCAAQDQVTADGEVLDTDRVCFLRSHLRAVHRAIEEGYPCEAWFVWSLMDNFEWAWGYDRRFGITRIDYPTQRRIPKQSFRWYQETIRQNRVV